MTMSLLVTWVLLWPRSNAEPPAVARTGSIGTGPPAGPAPLVWDMRVPGTSATRRTWGPPGATKRAALAAFLRGGVEPEQDFNLHEPGLHRRHLRPRGARPTASSSARRGARSSPRSPAHFADYAAAFGRGPGAVPIARGGHIGDPRLVYGKKSGTWYMFFDTQSCGSVGAKTWDRFRSPVQALGLRWKISRPDHRIARTRPVHVSAAVRGSRRRAHLPCFYEDKQVTIRAAELIATARAPPRARQRGEPCFPTGRPIA